MKDRITDLFLSVFGAVYGASMYSEFIKIAIAAAVPIVVKEALIYGRKAAIYLYSKIADRNNVR